ncbi:MULTISPECIES: sensor histidine kinase [Vallitalea]|uniref:Uncharacterized protein n=1 Tax=Vallitalea maricola TaxID=3074433 RepID=A0ACB5UDK7_9FIRM|nr:HAMP domain-containing sensor histidine kinase [Vallitalea guaymasensis]GMQ60841.1 hypothetical protein AN2V17_00670 [Vallitalea sp. AN17-2]
MNYHEKSIIENFSVLLDDWLNIYQQTRKPEIIAKIVHEIKNPISLIRSTLQLIEVQTPEVKENIHWSSLYEELDYICLLLNDFNTLNYSFNIQKTCVDVSTLLDSVAKYFYSSAYSKNINFYMTKSKDLPVISGDKTRLKEAFMNLIKNAIEATDENGTVTVDINYLDSFLLITVSDTGSGIREDRIDEIFKPFVTYKENGTGLGLPIVKSIIEQHCGTIEVETKEGEGTSFIISLPINTEQALQVQ